MSLKKNVFDIVKYCKEKNCEKVEYAKITTGGNDPSISKAMRYSQVLKSTRSGNALYKVRIPDPPTNVTATAGISSANISWETPDYYGGTKILYYTVYAYPTNNNLLSSAVVSYTNSITIAGLTNGSSYSFSVLATNTVGKSAYSTRSNTIVARTVPATPGLLQLDTSGNTSNMLIMSWSFLPIMNSGGIYNNGTPFFNGGANIQSYTIKAINSNIIIIVPISDVNTITSLDGKTTKYNTILSGLNSGTTYTFNILATNEAGDSPYSTLPASQLVP